jgi:hypothetical protein
MHLTEDAHMSGRKMEDVYILHNILPHTYMLVARVA